MTEEKPSSGGQQAADQLRTREGLEGTLARPRTYAYYDAADLPMQAAVLAHGIAETQPFIDGNKRIALIALDTFLRVNGFRLTAPQMDRAQWILDLSSGLEPAQLAERIR